MKIFGRELSLRKKAAGTLAPVDGRDRGWWPTVREPYSGAWQNDDETCIDTSASYYAVYACVTLISNDIGKLRPMLTQMDSDGIWSETTSPAFSPVLRKPNRFQNHIQFKQYWITSKLLRGNVYVLKQRDARGVVIAEYVLDSSRVTPLVAPDGSIFYQLSTDNLAGIQESSVTVPASEIIHDRMNCLFHPLVGVSPIYACGLAALQGQRIQRDGSRFFANGANPGGVLTAPGSIGDETAKRLKDHWDANYTGQNSGKVAILGDGLKFEPMRMTSVDAQMIEQLKWTAEAVCSCFHVPAYKVGIGAPPSYNNIEALQQDYYSTCLQILIEDMELCQDEGLALPPQYGIELDLDGLLRMDTATMIKAEADAVGAGIKAPNESRRRLNLKPVKGGETPYLQQQNYSLSALAKRDSLTNQFSPQGNGQAQTSIDIEQVANELGKSFDLVMENARPLRVVSKFSEDQPRVPAGNHDGGQWTSDGSGGASPSEAPSSGKSESEFNDLNNASENERRQFEDDQYSQGSVDSEFNEDGTAFQQYAENEFSKINSALRAEDVPENLKETVSSLDAGVQNYKATKDFVVWRGISENASVMDGLNEGDRIFDRGFVSTSLDASVASEFSGGNRIMKILIPEGANAYPMNAMGYGRFSSEHEFLLPRNSTFLVREIRGDEVVVELVGNSSSVSSAKSGLPRKSKSGNDKKINDSKFTESGIGLIIKKANKPEN